HAEIPISDTQTVGEGEVKLRAQRTLINDIVYRGVRRQNNFIIGIVDLRLAIGIESRESKAPQTICRITCYKYSIGGSIITCIVTGNIVGAHFIVVISKIRQDIPTEIRTVNGQNIQPR